MALTMAFRFLRAAAVSLSSSSATAYASLLPIPDPSAAAGRLGIFHYFGSSRKSSSTLCPDTSEDRCVDGPVPRSGAVSRGYNFASAWEQNAPLTEQQQAAIVSLSDAVAERPFTLNLDLLQAPDGKDAKFSVSADGSELDESGPIDAVLVNNHQNLCDSQIKDLFPETGTLTVAFADRYTPTLASETRWSLVFRCGGFVLGPFLSTDCLSKIDVLTPYIAIGYSGSKYTIGLYRTCLQSWINSNLDISLPDIMTKTQRIAHRLQERKGCLSRSLLIDIREKEFPILYQEFGRTADGVPKFNQSFQKPYEVKCIGCGGPMASTLLQKFPPFIDGHIDVINTHREKAIYCCFLKVFLANPYCGGTVQILTYNHQLNRWVFNERHMNELRHKLARNMTFPPAMLASYAMEIASRNHDQILKGCLPRELNGYCLRNLNARSSATHR